MPDIKKKICIQCKEKFIDGLNVPLGSLKCAKCDKSQQFRDAVNESMIRHQKIKNVFEKQMEPLKKTIKKLHQKMYDEFLDRVFPENGN